MNINIVLCEVRASLANFIVIHMQGEDDHHEPTHSEGEGITDRFHWTLLRHCLKNKGNETNN